MDNSKSNIIKEITQELDCGNNCYYNSKTNEIIAIPDFSQILDDEEFKELFRENLTKVNNKKKDFIKIKVPESYKSFKIMERFIEQVTDQNFQLKMENILQRKNPFQNFKHAIDNSIFRQKWFDFKQSELEKIVKSQLNR